MDPMFQQINVSVFSYKPDVRDNNAILYSISVTNKTNDSWVLEKRYSAFDDLQKKLRDFFGETLPKLPKKSYITFLVGKSHDDIEERRLGLDGYLRDLVRRPDVIASEPMKQFLELEKHARDILVTPPEQITEFTGFLHGVRDFLICPEQGVMFVVNSDCSVITRLDAYITNMKAPWESENGEEALIPVGCVECWLAGDKGEFTRQWTKMYNSQAMCCYWDPAACVLLVGLDSGSINYLSVPFADGLKRFDESMEIEQHLDRVMGVYYDKERQLIHSISKDKKYRILSMVKESLVADLEPGSFELTQLLVSQERKKSFIGDRCGNIYIFDLQNVKPSPVIHISTTLKFIRGFNIDSNKNYLFAVGFEDGAISVFDINKPGREQHTKEIIKLTGRQKSREISWAPKRGEIFIGNVDGTVTIWDAKKACPIYVIKAHEGDITKIVWLEGDQTLLTSGKDKKIRAWRLPQNWRDQNIVEKEKEQFISKEKQQNIEQLTKKLSNVKLQDDDEDEYVVWHKDEQKEHAQIVDERELSDPIK